MAPARLRTLDILRVVAVLLVMVRHLAPPAPDMPSWLLTVTSMLIRGGWIGVDLFFVLSGFLVSGLLFKEYQRTGMVDIGRFLIRRGFKIYPPFYVLLLVLVVVGWDVLTWRRILIDVFFVQNYFSPSVTWATWSLAIEEHFYLMLACLTWCLVRWRSQPFRCIPVIWITVAVSCLAARMSLMDRPFDTSTHLLPTHLRIDALL